MRALIFTPVWDNGDAKWVDAETCVNRWIQQHSKYNIKDIKVTIKDAVQGDLSKHIQVVANIIVFYEE